MALVKTCLGGLAVNEFSLFPVSLRLCNPDLYEEALAWIFFLLSAFQVIGLILLLNILSLVIKSSDTSKSSNMELAVAAP